MVCDSCRGLVAMGAPLTVVVLAAGKGTRMKSGLPKVLHRVAGRPMIGHVLAAAAALDPARAVVVLAPGMAEVEAELARSALAPAVAIQEPALGTGHALMAARERLAPEGRVLVLYGDTPLVTAETLRRLLAVVEEAGAAVGVLGMRPPDTTGYGWRCTAIEGPWLEGVGVNSQAQLADAEALLQVRLRQAAMEQGVTLTAPDTVFLACDTALAPGVEVGPYVVFGPGVEVAEGAQIHSFSHLEGVRVGPGARIGPFARLRPGAEIGESVHIGNFVEVKNAKFEAGAKANHLSYIGDARVGAGSNIGAGTITCNYDGVAKHRTEIGVGV